jgi:carbonic anhydrase
MSFATAINCMDGRTQLPVNEYMRSRYGCDYVDTITEPGPIAILAGGGDEQLLASVWTRVDISVRKHGSNAICVVGHHDCAGNPVDRATQEEQIRKSVAVLRDRYPEADVVGLWVGDQWTVEEV